MSTAIRAGGRRHTGRSRRDLAAGAAFLAPTIALIIVLRVAPALAAVGASTKSGLPGSLAAPTFVGADVFARLFAKESFWESVRQTLVFNILVNPIQIALALALAVLLTRRLPASGLWRTLIFLPSAVPLAGSTIVWGIALRPDGPVNGAGARRENPRNPAGFTSHFSRVFRRRTSAGVCPPWCPSITTTVFRWRTCPDRG